MRYLKFQKTKSLSLILLLFFCFSIGLNAQNPASNQGGVLDNINTEGKKDDDFFNSKMEREGVADLKDFIMSDEQKIARIDRIEKEEAREKKLKERNKGKVAAPARKKFGTKAVGRTMKEDKKFLAAKKKAAAKKKKVKSKTGAKPKKGTKSKIATKPKTGSKPKKTIKKKPNASGSKKTTKPKQPRKPIKRRG